MGATYKWGFLEKNMAGNLLGFLKTQSETTIQVFPVNWRCTVIVC